MLVKVNINVCVKLPRGVPAATVQSWILHSDMEAAYTEFVRLMDKADIDSARFAVAVDSATAGINCVSRALPRQLHGGKATGDSDSDSDSDSEDRADGKLGSYNVMFALTVRSDAIHAAQIMHLCWNLPYGRTNVALLGSSSGMSLNYGNAVWHSQHPSEQGDSGATLSPFL